MKIKAKDAAPGQWYECRGVRMLFVGIGIDNEAMFGCKAGSVLWVRPETEITHLPGCTGWDWEPEKPTTPDPGDGWRIAEGEDWKDERCQTWVPRSEGGFWDERVNKGKPFTHYFYRIPIDPKFRPFANAEEFKPHRDRWWRYKADRKSALRPPALHNDSSHRYEPWGSSFEYKVFDDGSPFGVEVKE